MRNLGRRAVNAAVVKAFEQLLITYAGRDSIPVSDIKVMRDRLRVLT